MHSHERQGHHPLGLKGTEQAPAGRGRVCGQWLPRCSPALLLIPVGFETSFKNSQYRNLAAEASLWTPAKAAVLRLALFNQLPDPCTWQMANQSQWGRCAPLPLMTVGSCAEGGSLCGLVLSGANFQSEVTVFFLV